MERMVHAEWGGAAEATVRGLRRMKLLPNRPSVSAAGSPRRHPKPGLPDMTNKDRISGTPEIRESTSLSPQPGGGCV